MLLALETRLWPSTASLDEEDSSSYGGFFQSTVRGIAALALATTLFSSALSGQVAQQDQSDFAHGVVSAPDEDYWQNQAHPVPPSLYQALPYFFEAGEIVPAPAVPQPDEDLWRSGVAPVWWTNLYPQQATFDSQEPVLFGQYDEDFWRNPVAPVAANLYHSPLLGDQEEIPGALLFGQSPEEYWQNPTRPVAATLYQSLPYLFESADFVPLIVPEFDEDFWQSGVAPVPPSLYRSPVFRDPEEVPGTLLKSQAVDEYYWQNWTHPVSPTLYQQLPYAFESGELNGPVQNGTAQPAGLSLVIAENNPTASSQASGGGGGRRRGRMYPVPVSERRPTSAIARARGQALTARAGQISASGTARTTLGALNLIAVVGKPTGKGIRNLTDEELMAILMGL